MQMSPEGLKEVAAFDTMDGLYDCAWSEVRNLVCSTRLAMVYIDYFCQVFAVEAVFRHILALCVMLDAWQLHMKALHAVMSL